jgi:hypothetical protein
MSVLPPDVHAELAQLLDALQSSDNSVRSQAEQHLGDSWTQQKPDMLLMGLVEQIQGSNDPTVGDMNPNHQICEGALSLTYSTATDTRFCSSYLPPNCLQGAQTSQRRQHRAVPFVTSRTGLCHQGEAHRSTWVRIYE